MLLPPNIDWLSWAGRINQLALIPFLAFLWTISRIPDAPKRMVHGWYLYILFVAVAIPAGIYSKAHLGTSVANVDWLHGPCELLLTLANLFIVLGLRDALRAATAAKQASSSAAGEPTTTKEATVAAPGGQVVERVQHLQHQQDPLSDIQYMQQLHSMYSSKHNFEGASGAAAGLHESSSSVTNSVSNGVTLPDVPDDISRSARGAHGRDAVIPQAAMARRVVLQPRRAAVHAVQMARVCSRHRSSCVLHAKPSVAACRYASTL